MASPNEGLCKRCTLQIEWKKKYRKYKPLTQAGKCLSCHQKTVTRAYHKYCEKCALTKKVCAKCIEPKDIVRTFNEKELARKEEEELEKMVNSMTERQRKTFFRKYYQQRDESGDSGDDDQNDEDDKEIEVKESFESDDNSEEIAPNNENNTLNNIDTVNKDKDHTLQKEDLQENNIFSKEGSNESFDDFDNSEDIENKKEDENNAVQSQMKMESFSLGNLGGNSNDLQKMLQNFSSSFTLENNESTKNDLIDEFPDD
jgi:hypothetical protein